MLTNAITSAGRSRTQDVPVLAVDKVPACAADALITMRMKVTYARGDGVEGVEVRATREQLLANIRALLAADGCAQHQSSAARSASGAVLRAKMSQEPDGTSGKAFLIRRRGAAPCRRAAAVLCSPEPTVTTAPARRGNRKRIRAQAQLLLRETPTRTGQETEEGRQAGREVSPQGAWPGGLCLRGGA